MQHLHKRLVAGCIFITINIISDETWKETHNYGFNFQLTIQGGPINVNFDLSLLIISTSLTIPNDKINVDERRQI